MSTNASDIQAAFQQTLARNAGLMAQISAALSPIVAGGINQFGESAAEVGAQRGQAIQSSAVSAAETSNAVRSELASQGGGNTSLPGGASAAIGQSIAQNAAEQLAQTEMGITQQGYAIGRQNFMNATEGLAGTTAALENPETGMAGAVTNAGNASMNAQETLAAQNRAWESQVFGLLGGGLSAVLGLPAVKGGGGGGGNTGGGGPQQMSMAGYSSSGPISWPSTPSTGEGNLPLPPNGGGGNSSLVNAGTVGLATAGQ